MKLITETIGAAETLVENVDNKRYYFIEGVFMQSEIKNRNGRVYPRAVMESEVSRYTEAKINNKTAYGELGHPQGPTINPERISHMIESLTWNGNNVVGRAKILDTDYGIIAQKILEGGGRLGVSSRGLGSLKEQNGVMQVQNDYYIATAADIVTDPSAPEAFVNGILEDVDWILNAGVWSPKFVEEARKSIKSAPKSQIEEQTLRAWKTFLSNL